ncbi:MAG TPA: bifunctional 4-hydroxy-2-oxoglutarate aldolase/2-dehydro-3-deoxy-phosphogluconate aldolase [Planctomycetota bacterium]|nr:bifunctional 4-hydroxy-2-oxoglutarate aldolase/2-dehydro-3-deoxy-phosphogluconate aldolase [Planctomycetota bacterium]
MKKEGVLGALRATGVVAVIRTEHSSDLVSVAEALWEGGVRLIEITLTVPGALEVIRESIARIGKDRAFVGAGTVLDAQAARDAIDAGAAFVVSPGLDHQTVALCNEAGVLVMPGAFTPHEILQAWKAGADVVKVFPADLGGPDYIKTVKEPLPQVELLPTKGITLSSAPAFIRAGAMAVGAGSALVNGAMIRSREYARITENASAFVRAVRAAREG